MGDWDGYAGCVGKVDTVDARLKRVGVGRQLYNHAERIMLSNGVTLVYVFSLPSAVPFWIRMGFRSFHFDMAFDVYMLKILY